MSLNFYRLNANHLAVFFNLDTVQDRACFPYPVADPRGGPETRTPLPLLKLVQKKMAAATGHKFHESSGPPGQISGSATGTYPNIYTLINL